MMYSTYDYIGFDLGGATNNLCKGEEVTIEGVTYGFNEQGRLSGEYPLSIVDKIARHIADEKKLPYIVIVQNGGDSAGWYIKYRSVRDVLNVSPRIGKCRLIERY